MADDQDQDARVEADQPVDPGLTQVPKSRRRWVLLVLISGIALAAVGVWMLLSGGSMIVRGRVLDAADGAPIQGVLVTYSPQPKDAKGATAVYTDASGNFKLENVPKGATMRASQKSYGSVETKAASSLALKMSFVPQTISGVLQAPNCYGGYQIVNASVTVRNESDQVIASTTTSDAQEGSNYFFCTVTFDVRGVAKAQFYQFQIGTHGGPSYSLADMEGKDWQVELSLGD